MSQPFQCLYICPGKDLGKCDILAAASGSCIYCFDIVSENLVSVLILQQDQEHLLKIAADTDAKKPKDAISDEIAHDDFVRPSKRQKVSSLGDGPGTSTYLPFEGDHDSKAKPSTASQPPSAAIIKLTGTRNGQYLIAVTDDKYIRVVECLQDNSLKQLSERLMPKRPCAISLTPDENTILCADKFGDVYSLPLLELPSTGSPANESGLCRTSMKEDEPVKKHFTPAANTKTVHTLRNRKALRDQQAHTNLVPKSKSSNFMHRLLLGHVSMLTDLLCISVPDYTSNPHQPRTYIFTSDRDEHIRVSRGMPQAHMIEGFCLGHTEFVSKLCIPRWHEQILISGGGDDYLLTWNWFSRELLQQVDLKSHVDDFRTHFISASNRLGTNLMQDLSEGSENHLTSIAISGIWAVAGPGVNLGNPNGEVIVACEGVPALFMFHLGSDLKLIFREYITLVGNVLDVAVMDDRCTIIYSLDTFHVPFSTTKIACIDDQTAKSAIGCLTLDSSGIWKQRGIMQNVMASIESEARKNEGCMKQGNDGGSLSSLFYGIENLRKRGQDEPE